MRRAKIMNCDPAAIFDCRAVFSHNTGYEDVRWG
jgi:hypothetical protein